MGIDNKLILEYSKQLSILYVEDDEILRNATKKILSNYFKSVDTAFDGKDGLEKFTQYKEDNDTYYDLVISDINMPRMDGIDMCRAIIDENYEQAILFITAHNEASFLHSAIEIGVTGFLTKPISPEQLKLILYKTAQAISDRKQVDAFYKQVEDLNMKLQEQNDQINEDKVKLEEQIKLLKSQENATNTKHQQVEKLLQQRNPKASESVLKEYFEGDEDEGIENVLFISDDCDELSEIFDDVPELIMQYHTEQNIESIHRLVSDLAKASAILLRYTPFLDPLAKSFDELSFSINEKIDNFVKMIEADPDNMMMLFDAIGIDMDRYTERFSVESMAMKNIHHIHHPTTLSVQQIIGIISPEDVDEGEMEFF